MLLMDFYRDNNQNNKLDTLSLNHIYLSCVLGDMFFSSFLDEFIDFLGNDNIRRMLDIYKDILDKKFINSTEELINVIRIDFEKIIYALLEIENKKSNQLLNYFFNDQNEFLQIRLLMNNSIYHVGFEINEPIDLFLYGLVYWISKFNQYFKKSLKIIKYLRFPSSNELQQSMNAYIEIIRVWLKVDNRQLMLELFDVQHKSKYLSKLKNNNFDQYCDKNCDKSCDENCDIYFSNYFKFITSLFENDNIFHYALFVDNAQKVIKIHNELINLSKTNSNFVMPFNDKIIKNINDGSYFTKIKNINKKMQVEFVTELDMKI